MGESFIKKQLKVGLSNVVKFNNTPSKETKDMSYHSYEN